MKTKVDIISGFLGAGKTTFINKLLENEEYKRDVALIENEFGDIGIDGDLISNPDINIKEINAGCICCSVADNFNSGIITIIEKYKPKRMIIEPSGVAKLSEIVSICNKDNIKDLLEINSIITVVDGTKFNLYLTNFSEFYINQIKNANFIFISRKENLGDDLDKVINQIKGLNKKVKIINNLEELNLEKVDEDIRKRTLNKNSLDFNNVFLHNEITSTVLSANNKKKTVIEKGSFKIANKGTINRTKDSFQSIGINTEKIFSEDELRYVIKKTKYFGDILRVKGFVQLNENEYFQFNFVPDELEINIVKYKGTGKVSIIGQRLNKKGLESLFS